MSEVVGMRLLASKTWRAEFMLQAVMDERMAV
jgi:hypothetical protein